jgi:hypothetical protein
MSVRACLAHRVSSKHIIATQQDAEWKKNSNLTLLSYDYDTALFHGLLL